MEFHEVILGRNRDLQVLARKLNVRAGEKIFPVMSREDIEHWLKERLNGARSLKEVKDPQTIAFPRFDQELVDLVMGGNPDEITVLGRTFQVEYRDGYAPRITLDREAIIAHGWRELPDAGVKLPGGRLVEVVVAFGGYDTIAGKEIRELKSRCMCRANEGLWNNWPTEGRPAIALPDPADPTSVVPEIIECRYGTSVVDGSDLVAFGASALKEYRYSSSDPYFNAKWFRDREEADNARAQSAAKLESLREEAIRQRQLGEARTAAEAAQRRLLDLCNFGEGLQGVDSELYGQAHERRYAWLPADLEDLQAWAQETEALIGACEAAKAGFVTQQRAKEEADRRELAAILPHVGDGIDEARDVLAFAKIVAAGLGAHDGAEFLQGQLNANYGYARRQAAVEDRIPTLSVSGEGSKFLRFRRAQDVDAWLAGAGAWLESQPRNARQALPKSKAAPVSAAPSSSATVNLAALQARFNKKK